MCDLMLAVIAYFDKQKYSSTNGWGKAAVDGYDTTFWINSCKIASIASVRVSFTTDGEFVATRTHDLADSVGVQRLELGIVLHTSNNDVRMNLSTIDEWNSFITGVELNRVEQSSNSVKAIDDAAVDKTLLDVFKRFFKSAQNTHVSATTSDRLGWCIPPFTGYPVFYNGSKKVFEITGVWFLPKDSNDRVPQDMLGLTALIESDVPCEIEVMYRDNTEDYRPRKGYLKSQADFQAFTALVAAYVDSVTDSTEDEIPTQSSTESAITPVVTSDVVKETFTTVVPATGYYQMFALDSNGVIWGYQSIAIGGCNWTRVPTPSDELRVARFLASGQPK